VIATVVDWATIGEVAAYALLSGVGLSLAFSLAILGATRFADMRRDERDLEAAAFGVLGLVGFAATIAALALGIIVMTTK